MFINKSKIQFESHSQLSKVTNEFGETNTTPRTGLNGGPCG